MCFVQYPVWKYAVQYIVLITPTIAMVHQQMQGLWQRRKEVSTFFDPLKHPDLSPLENDPFLLFWRGHSVKKRPLSVIPQPLQIVQD